MWFPGAERRYTHFLNPGITYALGKVYLNQAGLAVLHPGLYAQNFRDLFTNSLLIRSRLQLQAKHSPSDIPARVTQAYNSGAGGRSKV